MERVILHVDMDAFFAAIEERDRPELGGRPIVVGADPKGGRGRGVVSTANYAARRFGTRSGMPISLAYTLCPEAAFLPVDGKKYAQVSERIMHVLRPYGSAFEQVSIDEAYLDLAVAHWQAAEKIAREIKKEIYDVERLTCSVGIGPNKLIAKIASEDKKPNGLTLVRPEEVREFLDPKSVRALHGVGPRTEERLNRLKIRTVADLRAWMREALITEFGKFGNDLYQMARGLDDQPVIERHEIKSIGRQTTFPEDTRNRGAILKNLIERAREVYEELIAGNLAFKTVTVVVRYRGFETHTHARTLRHHIQEFSTLKAQLFKLALPHIGGGPVRLIGLRVSQLMVNAQDRTQPSPPALDRQRAP